MHFSFQRIVVRVIKKFTVQPYIEFILLPLARSGHWVPTLFFLNISVVCKINWHLA